MIALGCKTQAGKILGRILCRAFSPRTLRGLHTQAFGLGWYVTHFQRVTVMAAELLRLAA